MFYQAMLLDLSGVTGLLELQSGTTLSTRQDMTDGIPSPGQEVAPVNLSALPGMGLELMTNAISGQHGNDLSAPVVPKSFSESKSRTVTLPDGHRVTMITCGVCGIEKNCDEFRTHGSRRKFRGTCRDCQNEAERKRKLNNATRTAEQRKEWRRANRGSALVSSARCRARDKNLPFDLDAMEIQRRIDIGRCEMTGIPFDLDGDWNSPSLDRIDPNGGYTMSNVRIVITALNVMMNKWGADKVLEIASALKTTSQVRKSSELLTRSLQEKLQKRVSQLGSTLFNLTWKESATPSGRLIFRLRASVRRTSGSDFSSWPTPVSQPANGTPEAFLERKRKAVANGSSMGICLSDLQMVAQLASWATPRSTETGHSSGNPDRAEDSKSRLEDQVFLAGGATPTARDFKSESATDEFNEKRWDHPRGKPLSAEVLLADSGETLNGSTARTESTGQLNPALSLWLMGLPQEWLNCAESAMPSSRQSRKNS